MNIRNSMKVEIFQWKIPGRSWKYGKYPPRLEYPMEASWYILRFKRIFKRCSVVFYGIYDCVVVFGAKSWCKKKFHPSNRTLPEFSQNLLLECSLWLEHVPYFQNLPDTFRGIFLTGSGNMLFYLGIV